MSQDVLYGAWIYWPRGRILGLYVTLSAHHGNILTNALAITLPLVGQRFWAIVALSLHQILACQDKVDGLMDAVLITLRNSGSDIGAACSLITLLVAWRKTESRSKSITLLILFLATIHAVGWIAAGIMTAYIVSSTDDVARLAPFQPGYAYSARSSNNITNSILVDEVPWLATMSSFSQAYGRACYNQNGPQSGSACNQYFTPSLPYSKSSISCPFDPSICILKDSEGAISFDTGYLSPSRHFGIASDDGGAVLYRRVATCAPLDLTNYQRTELIGGQNYTVFLTGPLYGDLYGNNIGVADYTYRYPVDQMDIYRYNAGYGLISIGYSPKSQYPPWRPIAALMREDADVSILFITMNSVKYETPVFDVLFNASVPYRSGEYVPYSPVAAASCITQHQICNSNTALCSELMSITDLIDSVNYDSIPNGLSTNQILTANRILNAAIFSNTDVAAITLGPAALNASLLIFQFDQISPGLPENQWQIEMEGLWQTSLALHQNQVQSWVRKDVGNQYLSLQDLKVPDSGYETTMIYSQIVQSNGNFTTFSLTSIIILACLCTVIVVSSVFVEKIASLFHSKPEAGSNAEEKDDRLRDDHILELWRSSRGEIAGMTWDWATWFKIPVLKPRKDSLSVSSGVQSSPTGPERSSGEHTTAEHTTTEHTTTEPTTAEQGTAEQPTTEHLTIEQPATEHTATENNTAERTTAEHTTAEQHITEQTPHPVPALLQARATM